MRRALFLLFCLAAVCWAQGGYSGSGRYLIFNVKSGKALELDPRSSYVVQNIDNRSPSQIWTISGAGRGGTVTIRNERNGCALTPGGDRNSTPVRCVPFNQGPNQAWSLQPGKDGNPLIVSRIGKVLDIPNGSTNSGARVQTYDRNGEDNQRFRFQRVASRPGVPGSGNPDRGSIVCASNDGRRNYCAADTSRGVILVRQLGQVSCTQGQTWGMDRNGIWVDRGCKGEFRVGR